MTIQMSGLIKVFSKTQKYYKNIKTLEDAVSLRINVMH